LPKGFYRETLSIIMSAGNEMGLHRIKTRAGTTSKTRIRHHTTLNAFKGCKTQARPHALVGPIRLRNPPHGHRWVPDKRIRQLATLSRIAEGGYAEKCGRSSRISCVPRSPRDPRPGSCEERGADGVGDALFFAGDGHRVPGGGNLFAKPRAKHTAPQDDTRCAFVVGPSDSSFGAISVGQADSPPVLLLEREVVIGRARVLRSRRDHC
jgi:hypothetical protein